MASSPRPTYHHGSLALALLGEAARMIESTGEKDFSLRECAKALRVDVAAVYRHYVSKDALMAALARHGVQELGRRVERAAARVAAQGPAAEFLAIGRAYVDFALDRPTLYSVVFERRSSANCGQAEDGASAYDCLCKCLDRLVAEGLISQAARPGADSTAWAAVHGLASLLNTGLIRPSKRERQQLIEHLCQTVLAGLTRAPG